VKGSHRKGAVHHTEPEEGYTPDNGARTGGGGNRSCNAAPARDVINENRVSPKERGRKRWDGKVSKELGLIYW